MIFTDYECPHCGDSFRSWESNVRGWCKKEDCKIKNDVKLKDCSLADVLMVKLYTAEYPESDLKTFVVVTLFQHGREDITSSWLTKRD